MAPRLSIVPSSTGSRPAQFAGAPRQRLSLVRDDIAIRVESEIDARFWVRLEVEGVDELVVTDFTAGGRPEVELIDAMVMAVEALEPGPFRRMVFRDLIPAGHQSAQFPVRVVEAFDRVKRLAEAVADAEGRSVATATMEPRRGKLDAIIQFH